MQSPPVSIDHPSRDLHPVLFKPVRTLVNQDVDIHVWQQAFIPAYEKLLGDAADSRNLTSAIQTFEKVMEYPSSTWDGKQRIQAECHTRIGLAYWRMRMFHVAVTHFSKALELCHDDGILWLFRALARIPVELPEKVSFKFHDVFMALELISKSGEWRHAKEIVMIAARMNPHDAMAFYIRGRIHLKTHVLEEAAKDLTVPILRGLDASGRDYAFLHYERGMAYAFAGDYDKAIHDYTQSLRLDPTHANALAGRAACYTEIKCYDKALADWTLHVDLTNSAAVVAEMGRVLRLAGRLEESRTYYSNAIHANPLEAVLYRERCLTLLDWIHKRRQTIDGKTDDPLSLDVLPSDTENIRAWVREAEQDAIQAVVLDASDSFSFMDRMDPLGKTGIYTHIANAFGERLKRDAHDVVACLACAVAYFGLGRYADCFQMAERAYQPDTAGCAHFCVANLVARMMGLMSCMKMRAQFRLAPQRATRKLDQPNEWERSILRPEFFDHYTALLHDRHGLEEYYAGHYKTAVSHFTDAIQAQARMGQVTRPVAKIATFRPHVKLARTIEYHGAFFDHRGRAYEGAGELGYALLDYEMALGHDPTHRALLDSRSRVWIKLYAFCHNVVSAPHQKLPPVQTAHTIAASHILGPGECLGRLTVHSCLSLLYNELDPLRFHGRCMVPHCPPHLKAQMASDNVHERARAVVQMYPLTVAARSRQYDAMRPVETPRNPPTNADLGLALICAAYANDTYGMEILLQHKNPEQFVEVTTEDGRTALMYAAYHGNVAIVSTLLTIKADLARQDLMGRTAMHYAAMANRPAVLGLLQRRGASPLVFDKADKKPSDYAMERGSFDLGKALAKECQDRLREATHKMHEAKRPGPILAPLPSQTQDTSFAVEETKTMQETTRGLTETQMTHTTEEKREGRNTTEERKVTLDTTEEKQVMPDTTEEKQVMQNTTEEKQMTQDTTEETQVTRDTTEEKQVARGRTNQATRKTPTAERKTLVAHDPPHRNPWSDTLPFPRTETSSIWLPYAPVEVGPEVFAFDYEWIRTIFNVHLLRAVYTNMPFEPKDQNIIKTVYTQGNYYVYQRPLEGVTAASPFPTKDFKTFVEHLLKRHGREVDKDSPIVEARPFDMLASNVLRPTHGSEQTSKAKDPVLQLVSDACHVLTFPLSVVNEMKCLPSVLWNLESYLLVHELRAKMDMKIPLEMLRTAITTASAQEKYSLERLEFLGDSFLKWATSVYLFDRFERYTEEQLTIVRSRYVGNSSLYARAKAKNLHRYIHAKPFAPTKWQPPGFPPTCITDDSVQILSPKLVADTVEALVGAAFLSGGVWMAKACMAWLKLPSDMTLAKESQTPGVTSDQDGPLPTFHQETNDYHQRERVQAYVRSRDLIKMEVLKGARLTLISEIREIRKQLESNTREGQLLRNYVIRDQEKLTSLENAMRELGLPVYPRDMNVQQYYVSQQQAMGPLDAAQDSLSPESKVLDSRPPEDKAQDSRSSGVKVQAPPNTTHDSLPPFPQDTNARTLVRRFLTVLSILQGEQRELNTNTARGVILISNLKRLEDEVRYVDEARGHAEKNDLMNAAAHTTARLEGKNDTSRHDTFSIIKAHRYPDQKFMALIHAIPEIEKRLGYTFHKKMLLVQALTHGSYVYAESPTYQRLEFMGDAILELMISRQMFANYPALSPGDLTLLRQKLVCNLSFGTACTRGNLYKYLLHYSPAIHHAVKDHVREVEKYRREIKQPNVDVSEISPPDPPKDCGRKLSVTWKVYRRLTAGPAVMIELMPNLLLGEPDMRHVPYDPNDKDSDKADAENNEIYSR